MLAKSCFHGFSHNAPKILIIMLWHTVIHIHFVVLMEPQSSENCAFFVLASGHKYMYNKMLHEYSHTKVSMHARDQHGKEKTLLLLFISEFLFKRFFHCQISLSCL